LALIDKSVHKLSNRHRTDSAS